MKTIFSMTLLYIQIIQLRLAMLKYGFLIGFYSSMADDNNLRKQKN